MLKCQPPWMTPYSWRALDRDQSVSGSNEPEQQEVYITKSSHTSQCILLCTTWLPCNVDTYTFPRCITCFGGAFLINSYSFEGPVLADFIHLSPDIPISCSVLITLQWRHNEYDGVSNHRLLDRSLNSFFRRRSKKTIKFRVTGVCEGNSPVTGEFPT